MLLPRYFRYVEHAPTLPKQDPQRATTGSLQQHRHKEKPRQPRQRHRGRFTSRYGRAKPAFVNRLTGRRMVVEDMEGRCLDIHDILLLKVLDQKIQRDVRRPIPTLRYPYVRQIWAVAQNSFWALEVLHHTGNVETIPVSWAYTGLGPKARDGGEWHKRPQLVCPGCKKARRELFFDDRFGNRFACRECLGISHTSCQCSRPQRSLWQRMKIDDKLAQSKGKHRKTIRGLEEKKRALRQSRGRITERLSYRHMRRR